LFSMVIAEEGPASVLLPLSCWMKMPLLLVRWM